MEYWIAGVAAWGVCGFMVYGLTLGHFQNKFLLIADDNRRIDHRFALDMAMMGPLGLLSVGVFILLTSYHGFMWRLPPRRDGT